MWLAAAKMGVAQLLKRYPDLKPEEIGDEQAAILPDGSAEIFVVVRDVKIALIVPRDQFAVEGGARRTYEAPTTARGNERHRFYRASYTVFSPSFHNTFANTCQAARRRKNVQNVKLIAIIISIVLTVGIAGEYAIPFDAIVIYYLILAVCFSVAFAQQQQARRR